MYVVRRVRFCHGQSSLRSGHSKIGDALNDDASKLRWSVAPRHSSRRLSYPWPVPIGVAFPALRVEPGRPRTPRRTPSSPDAVLAWSFPNMVWQLSYGSSAFSPTVTTLFPVRERARVNHEDRVVWIEHEDDL